MSQSSGTSIPPRREPAASEASPLQRAIAALERMKARLDSIERAANEPIAIVGVGCRFPGGGEGIDAFWNVLEQGTDAVCEVPPERWPRGAIAADPPEARWAGLLADVSMFDTSFFGISPREAEELDPQQRMLLEVAWEALEDAGEPADGWVGGRVGVFVGICGSDYRDRVIARGKGVVDLYGTTGNLLSTAAGRISFVFGFQGPSMAIDTACSSSLVAIVEACQSLRLGDSDLALAGGVNGILSSTTMSLVIGLQALSPDGRCKTLDARANGYVRGEGCGLIVLKRLSDALRDGNPIHAVIRGWAVNQDGRSAGLTAPNVLAQQAMLRQALARARLEPADIGYVEMHGTGTPLGDPIEAEALREVFGAPRADGSSCVLGAVKSNIGHLEGAAGVAGIIKVVLSLERERIPRNLHFRRLNPRVSFVGTPFVVPTASVPWLRTDKPRRAGVSGFGVSGTNAHIIVEEAPHSNVKPAKEALVYLLPLSAKSHEALVAMAHSYAEWLASPNEISLPDLVYTASVRRMHHEHRLSVTFATREELSERLMAFSREEAWGVFQGRATKSERPRVVFIFPGQGSQWLGMGRDLLFREPVFRRAIEACDAEIQLVAGFSVLEELSSEQDVSRLSEIDVVQPVLFAIGVALASLWRAYGIEPDCVVGHSMGEVAAAHVAGMLDLRDSVKVICHRSRLLRRIRGQGAMALVELPVADAEQMIAAYADRLSIAVSNGPTSTVLSGDAAALELVLGTIEKRGIFCRRVKVDVASHSPQVEPLRADLLEALREIRPVMGTIAMQSTVVGDALKGEELSASYWWDNLRQTVRFSDATQALMKDGYGIFIEMSPHPILLPSIEESLRFVKREGVALASLSRNADGHRSMHDGLGALYCSGYPIDWRKRFPAAGRVVSLPAYPWQRERYWIELEDIQSGMSAEGRARVDSGLGRVVEQGARAPDIDSDIREKLALAAPEERPQLLVPVLGRIGAQVLGFRPGSFLDSTRPLIEMGMDSILAAQLSALLSERLGVRVPTIVLYESGTLSALASRIAQMWSSKREGRSASVEMGKRLSALEVWNAEGTKPPLFCVHPIEGLALAFQPFASRLDADQPLYVFQAASVVLGAPPLNRVEDLARQYIEELRAARPEGPYWLGGYSFGGIVAFEMARQLLERGDPPSGVLLIDSACPFVFNGAEQRLLAFCRLFGLGTDPQAMANLPWSERINRAATAFLEHRGAMPVSSASAPLLNAIRAHLEAICEYGSAFYAGQIDLIPAAGSLSDGAKREMDQLGGDYGWTDYCRKLVASDVVTGDHFAMVSEPHVDGLVERVQRVLKTKVEVSS